MIAINEYILNRNSKVIKGDSLFKTLDESMEYDKIKELFEKSSYEFIENTEHEKEPASEIRFRWESVNYIYKKFNLKEKQYLLAFTNTCEFIFAFNPDKKENYFVGYYYADGWGKNDRGFEKCYYGITEHHDLTSLKSIIEYLI